MIEIATRKQLHKLRVCDILPQVVSDARTFETDPARLELGCTRQDFESNRFDGSVDIDATNGATTLQRLQYIAKMLKVMHNGQNLGAQDSFKSKEDVPGNECYEIICGYSHQGEIPSFISMWAFINVLYFQSICLFNGMLKIFINMKIRTYVPKLCFELQLLQNCDCSGSMLTP